MHSRCPAGCEVNGQKRAVTVELTARSAYFAGAARHHLLQAVQSAGSPHQWSHQRGAVGVPLQFAAEVEAHLVAAGFSVWAPLPGVGA